MLINSERDTHQMNEELRNAIIEYFREQKEDAIIDINRISTEIMKQLNLGICEKDDEESNAFRENAEETSEDASQFIEYCRTTKMSYSYKMILIMAFLEESDSTGCMKTEKAVDYFRNYYNQRRAQGRLVEKAQCIYLDQNVSDDSIRRNLIANPVKALVAGGFFLFNKDFSILSMKPETWGSLGENDKRVILDICRQRLHEYYQD